MAVLHDPTGRHVIAVLHHVRDGRPLLLGEVLAHRQREDDPVVGVLGEPQRQRGRDVRILGGGPAHEPVVAAHAFLGRGRRRLREGLRPVGKDRGDGFPDLGLGIGEQGLLHGDREVRPKLRGEGCRAHPGVLVLGEACAYMQGEARLRGHRPNPRLAVTGQHLEHPAGHAPTEVTADGGVHEPDPRRRVPGERRECVHVGRAVLDHREPVRDQGEATAAAVISWSRASCLSQ